MKQQWSNNLGFILAAAGSAIGIGNIWKFPKLLYEGGGGAYMLVYLLIAALLGISILLAEFVLGRGTGENMLGAFTKRYSWVGKLGVFTAFLVLCYYFQAGGWVLRYLWGYITDAGAMLQDPAGVYSALMGNGTFPWQGAVIFPLIYIIINAIIVQGGIQRGVELLSRIAMPLMMVLLTVLLIRALTMQGASEGVAFLLHVDFSTLGFGGVLSALGQAFFSLSIGMSVMVTYGSFLKRDEPLLKNAVWVCFLDTLTALMAGFILIPAVFAIGARPTGGSSFAFVEIAAIFWDMPGGKVFALMFYALLFLAALVSSVSILQGVLCCIAEQYSIKQGRATVGICLLAFLLGIFYTSAPWGQWLEVLTDRFLMPIVAFFTCWYVGWVLDKKLLLRELGVRDGLWFKLWRVLVRFVAPIVIFVILLLSL